jgi:hypothetical protein
MAICSSSLSRGVWTSRQNLASKYRRSLVLQASERQPDSNAGSWSDQVNWSSSKLEFASWSPYQTDLFEAISKRSSAHTMSSQSWVPLAPMEWLYPVTSKLQSPHSPSTSPSGPSLTSSAGKSTTALRTTRPSTSSPGTGTTLLTNTSWSGS